MTDEEKDCGCNEPVAGAMFPVATNENYAEDWNYCVVERCDECDIFESDEAAGVAICKALNKLGLLSPPKQKFVVVEIPGVRGANTYNCALGIKTDTHTVELVDCRNAARIYRALKKACSR